MHDLATELRDYVDTFDESFDPAALIAKADRVTAAPLKAAPSLGRGVLVGVVAAVIVLVLIGGAVLTGGLLGESDPPVVTEPIPETTAPIPETTVPEPTAAPETTAPPETTAAPKPRRRSFAVDDFVFDEEGALWATTGEGRRYLYGVAVGTPRDLYKLEDGSWNRVDQPTVVFDAPDYWSIRPASGGGVYVASGSEPPPSPTSGVYWTDGSTWELYQQDFMCGVLAVDTDGSLWATCPDSLMRLVDGRWVDQGRDAWEVAAGPDGSVWYTSTSLQSGFDVWRFDGAQWATVPPCPDCLSPLAVLGVDETGGAWMSKGGCETGSLIRMDSSGEAQTYAVGGAEDIAFAEDGSAWVAIPCEEAGSPAGVAQITGTRIRLFTTDDGLPANDVHAVEVGPDGYVYIGTEAGIDRYLPDVDSWEPV